MTFTDYRTAARMRDVIAEVAGDVIDRRNLGYRYATVDNIDEVKNRANVIFGGEVTSVPVRMGAIKPTAGALVRVRGKHGDLHVEGVIDGSVDFDAGKVIFPNGVTSWIGYSDSTVDGGLKIADQNDEGHSWFPFRNGSFYFTSRPDMEAGGGDWNFRTWDGVTYTQVFTIESTGFVETTGGMEINGSVTMNGSILTIATTTPQIKFTDTDANSGYWLHHSGDFFYLLPDRNGDGSWETPYPFRVTMSGDVIHFWYGAGGATSSLGADGKLVVAGILQVNGDWYISGNLFLWTSAGRAVLENVNEIRGDDGAENDPTYTFGSNSQTGFYLNAGNMSFTEAGTRIFHVAGGVITGIGDNVHLLGNSSNRWKAVWAVDGTINTSDMSEKEEVIDSDLGLQFIRNMRPRRWRWRGGTRPHYGLAAQEVKQAIDAMGQDFAGFIDPAVTFMEDEYTEGVFEQPGPLGLRYHEFIAPMIKAIQELADRVDALEGSPSGPAA